MKKNHPFNRSIFILILLFLTAHSYGQTGLNFQGVARTNNNIILASQPISLRLSILQGSSTGIAEYVEIRRVTTNAQGLFTAVIGDTGAISSLGNFSTINWRNTPKFLKIEMDVAAGNNFITMGTTQFQYVAYAQFANSVDAENIIGVVPVARGGTGANSLSSFKITLALNNVNNTTDLSKPISTATQTALDLKLNAADTLRYVKQTYADSALLTKFNLKDTLKYVKQTYEDSALLTKLKLTDTASMLNNRIGRDTLNLSARINLKVNMSDLTTGLAIKLNAIDTSKYTKQNYSDSALLTKLKLSDTASMLSNRIGKDTLNLSARINLKANSADMTSGLLLKENAANKSTAVDLGGTSPSDILFPTQKAVKDYVTANASSGGVADGGISTIKLADGAVTDAKVASGISKSKVGLSNVENISINTWSGTSSLTTVGTITSGTWSGTTISLNNGGTGATTAAAARTNLGLVIGTNVQAPLIAGTDYLTPTGSASGLTNFPTLNQNTTGNAATAITAGNITATSNSTLTSLPNLTSLGTITSGTWSGTIIDVAHGGTGTSTVAANTFFSGPFGSSGAPNFRTLNITDIPDLSSRYISNNGTADFSSDITVSGQRIGIGNNPIEGRLNLLFGKNALSTLGVYNLDPVVNMNTAIGQYSQFDTYGNKNTSLGTFSLSHLGEGYNNTVIGAFSNTQNNLDENKFVDEEMFWGGGDDNTSIGSYALSYPRPSDEYRYRKYYSFNKNTVIGAYSLSGLSADFPIGIPVVSNGNTAIGYKAGSNLQIGSNNIIIGDSAQTTSTTVSNQIVIGNASNTSSYIYGALSTVGRISKLVTVTSNYTILSSDEIISANSTSPINIYLPSAIGIAGRTYTIKNINTGWVTLRPSFSQNIDGSNTYELANRYSFVKVVSNGSIWLVAGLDNVSYSVSGDQTITLTGDVLGTGTGSFSTTVNSIGGVSSSTISNFDSRISSNTNSITTNTSDIASLNSNLSAKQTGYTTLTSIGTLSNTTGYLKNNGSGAFSYTSPTTADISPSTNRNYVTDAQAGVLSNTSGSNTGDETVTTIKTKLGIIDPAISGNNNDQIQILTSSVGSGELLFKDLYDINTSLFDDKASLSAAQNNFTGDLKAKTYILTNPTTTTASTSTTTINLATGNVLEVLLNVNTTLSFTNPRIGTYIIKIKQDGTGGRTVTFPTIKWADDAVPTITTTANRTDLVTLIYDGAHYYATCLQNF